jgi:hypothetical protein
MSKRLVAPWARSFSEERQNRNLGLRLGFSGEGSRLPYLDRFRASHAHSHPQRTMEAMIIDGVKATVANQDAKYTPPIHSSV